MFCLLELYEIPPLNIFYRNIDYLDAEPEDTESCLYFLL